MTSVINLYGLHNPIAFTEDMLVFHNNNRFNMYDMPELNDDGDRRVWTQYDVEMKNLYGVERNDDIADIKNEMLDGLNTFFQNLYEMVEDFDE